MPRRIGRYTKQEKEDLIRMFNEGLSVYRICKNLNRSQKSIRNNLIRLNLIEGEITPRRYKSQVLVIEKNYSLSVSILNYTFYLIFMFSLTFFMVVKPIYNPVEMFVLGLMEIFYFLYF